MRHKHIPDGDSLFRQAIFSLAFKGKKFAPQRLIHLTEKAGALLLSLTWERYVPTIELVHGYGCRLASRMNEKMLDEGTYKDKNRRVYCGAYQLKGSAIRAMAGMDGLGEVLSADVVHHVEEGELAHTNLSVILKPEGGFDVEGTKTAIVDRLWNACTGPLKHICDYDKDVDVHQSSDLAPAPAALCVNNSETSSPSTISVGAEKDSHLHEQDQW
jgi:hypothetical protein